MSEEGTCSKCGEPCRCRRAAWVAAIVILLAVIVAGAVFHVRRQAAAEAAEAARVEAIMNKPLLCWTDDEKAEFAEAYETRRQSERATNPKLWTSAEKKSEWWSYSKLVVRQSFRNIWGRIVRR